MDAPTLRRALRATGFAIEVARASGLDGAGLRDAGEARLRSRLPPAGHRLRDGVCPLLLAGHGNIFARLLKDDTLGWFEADTQTVIKACARLAGRGAGPWGSLRHRLSNSVVEARWGGWDHGTVACVHNIGLGTPTRIAAKSRAEYRLVVDPAGPHRS